MPTASALPGRANGCRVGNPACVVVLGASGGIGRAVCDGLAARGRRFVAAGRDAERLTPITAGRDARAMTLDALDAAALEVVLRQVAEFGGGELAGIAHCIGSVVLKPAHATGEAEWREVMATNLDSAFLVVRAAARVMKAGGSVVLCSSTAARVGLANHEAIAAAKAGVEGLVRAAAATYAGRNLRFNAVAPGLVRTPQTARITDNPATLEQSMQMHPLGRIGDPQHVAAAILWLLDPANDWITGEVIGVDGGMARVRRVARS